MRARLVTLTLVANLATVPPSAGQSLAEVSRGGGGAQGHRRPAAGKGLYQRRPAARRSTRAGNQFGHL
jgi:hypothetical protein